MNNIVLNTEVKKYNVVLNQSVKTYNLVYNHSVRKYNIVNNTTVRKYNVYTIQNLKKYNIIVNNLYRGGSYADLVKANAYGKWHPDGVIFKYNVIESEDGSKKETISHSGGFIFIHQWPSNLGISLKNISYNDFVNSDNEVETPVFLLGETSQRVKALRYKQYYVSCNYYTSIKFYLDEDSLLGGNKININTGEVLWSEDWEGESVITVIATGKDSEKQAIHTVTTSVYDEMNPIYDTIDELTDLTPIYRKVKVTPNELEITSPGVHYLMLKYPLDEEEEYAAVLVSETYLRETLFDGYLNILLGILNSVDDKRIFALEWGNSGLNEPKVIPPTIIQTRWKDVSKTCLLDENGKNTGKQEIHQKKQKLVNGLWVDMLEETTIIVTNTNDCPIPQPNYFMATCVNIDSYDKTTEKIIPFSRNQIAVQSNTKVGYNYIYFSTPEVFGKPTILNSLNKDITYQFVEAGSDVREGFEPNKFWKRSSTFSTKTTTIFYLKV